MHLIFNVCVQLSVGIPLELLHGPLRVGLIYCAGIIAGKIDFYLSASLMNNGTNTKIYIMSTLFRNSCQFRVLGRKTLSPEPLWNPSDNY